MPFGTPTILEMSKIFEKLSENARLEMGTFTKDEAIRHTLSGRQKYIISRANKAYLSDVKEYLGSSTTYGSYRANILKRVEERKPLLRKNLYAMALPGGHGKSYLCKKYGFIDVDDLVHGEVYDKLQSMRKRLVVERSTEWVDHNRLWYAACRKVLDMMVFDRPALILVHTEEAAVELDAYYLGGIVLNSEQFYANISKRAEDSQTFACVSRKIGKHRSYNPPKICNRNWEVECTVISVCNEFNIPVAAPYAYSRRFKSKWYGLRVPEWILTGKVYGRIDDIDVVLDLCARGEIPKECVDHFVKVNYDIGKAYGYGTSMGDWALVCAWIISTGNKPRDFMWTEDLFDVFPPASEAEKHRVNITLRRIQAKTDAERDGCVNRIMRRHVGNKHVFVTSLVCHYLGIGKFISFIKELEPIYYVNQEEYSGIVSEFHNLIRVSGWYCGREIDEPTRQGLMYMNLLTGREMYVADVKKVLEERAIPMEDGVERKFVSYDPVLRRWTRRQYLIDFEAGLSEAYHKMKVEPRKIDVSGFLQFWKRRRQWVAKGSTVMNTFPKEMLKYSVKIAGKVAEKIELRHNKKSLFECNEILSMIKDEVDEWNATKVVPKLNETGKHRELLPGTLMHYIVFSYVLYAAEMQTQIGSTRINAEKDDDITWYDKKMKDGIHHLLYDWANFNAQHDVEDMAKVIMGLTNVPGAPLDYAMFCRAIAESFYCMYIIDEDGNKHKVDKGLYSGWRGTSWINGVLNFVYVSIGLRCVERIHGSNSVVYVDHGGDDLDLAFQKPSDCVNMLKVMEMIGYEAKQIKQMVANKAEFFRNTINAEGVYASPTRALANFVSGNWESGGAKTLTEKTTSVLDQTAKMARRGVNAEFANVMAQMCLEHWLKIKSEDEWLKIPDEIIHGRVDDGGFGVPDSKNRVWILEKPIKGADDTHFQVRLPGVYCSEDYVDEMIDELERGGLKVVDKPGLVKKLAENSYDLKTYLERINYESITKERHVVVGYQCVVEEKWDEDLIRDLFTWAKGNDSLVMLEPFEAKREFLGHLEFHGRLLEMKDLVMMQAGTVIKHELVEFKPDLYYRRLVPDFIGNFIHRWVLNRANSFDWSLDEMQEKFRTACFMMSVMYDHRA